ncbi:MAG TPA: hypothetical protein VIH82_01935 [Acidimicrobiia bacterium]
MPDELDQAFRVDPGGAPPSQESGAEIDTDFGTGVPGPAFTVTDDDGAPRFDTADDDDAGGISVQPVGIWSVEETTDDLDFTSVEDDDGGFPLTAIADDTAPVDPGAPDVPE